MIRLFVSDIDGTLLPDGQQDLPDAYFDKIKALTREGVLFCAASGRQYSSLQRLFAPVRDDIAYITQNGSSVIYKEEILYSSSLTKEDSDQLVRDTYAIPGAQVMYCTDTVAYCGENDHELYDLMLHQFRFNTKMVPNPLDIPMPCVKFSLYLRDHLQEKCQPYFIPRWSATHELVVIAPHFISIMKKGTNKGTALRGLMERLGISPDEAVACGDNGNDIAMLREVTHSVAVANAQEEVGRICRHIVPSNNEMGVLEMMNSLPITPQ